MAAACVRNIWTHTFISFSLSLSDTQFCFAISSFCFRNYRTNHKTLEKRFREHIWEKKKKQERKREKRSALMMTGTQSRHDFTCGFLFSFLPWWSTHEMITWRCNDLCLQGPPVRWSRQSSENKKTDDELDKISTSRRTPQKQGGSTSSNSQTQNTKKKKCENLYFFSYLLMVEFLWTTQAAILLPLTEDRGTGLRSFAFPLSHFLRRRREREEEEEKNNTHNVFQWRMR